MIGAELADNLFFTIYVSALLYFWELLNKTQDSEFLEADIQSILKKK